MLGCRNLSFLGSQKALFTADFQLLLRFRECVQPQKLRWQWKILNFHRRYKSSFMVRCFHCHVNFQGFTWGASQLVSGWLTNHGYEPLTSWDDPPSIPCELANNSLISSPVSGDRRSRDSQSRHPVDSETWTDPDLRSVGWICFEKNRKPSDRSFRLRIRETF